MSRFLTPQAAARLASLELVARSVVEGYISGLHKSPFHGFSVEFSEHREYCPGDDLRNYDWKVYGRTERNTIKLYHEETNLQSHLLIDASKSMGYQSAAGLPTKLEYALCLAAALAYLLVRQRDTAGMVTFGDRIERWIPPRGGAGHLHDLLSAMEAVRPQGKTALAGTLHQLAEMIKRRNLVILISDLLDDPKETMQALRHFRHNRHEVIVFHLFDRAELDFPFTGLCNFRDLETGQRVELQPQVFREEYLEAIGKFTSDYRRWCSENQIDYQVLDNSSPFDLSLAAYLVKRSRMN